MPPPSQGDDVGVQTGFVPFKRRRRCHGAAGTFKNGPGLCRPRYAGVDASPYQSGSFDSKSRHVSKRGSPHLRRVLFVIMSMTLIRANTANPVFCFMDKKRAEGKHFYVYTVAGSAKFLRIYYAKVKEYLNALEDTA